MNKVELLGRLTKAPEVRYAEGENPVAVGRYTLAVNRRWKKEGEAAGIAEEIYNDAMKCAAELMQVGAVCLRFINSNGKGWGR